MRLLVTGGGTGGHIYPAIAIAKRVLEKEPDCQALFAGTAEGMERDLARRAGLPFAAIPARGVIGKSPVEQLRGVAAAGAGFLAALRLVRRFRPDVVVGTGGYASGPVVAAAAALRVPTLIHEQNVFPGVTNRLLSRAVTCVAIPHPDAARHFPRRARLWLTGNPVRPEVLSADRAAARRRLGLGPEQKLLVIVMGSRGSATVNRVVAAALPDLLAERRVTVFWVTGAAHHEAVREMLDPRMISENQGKLRIEPYVHDLPDVLAASDLVVARASAITLAEIAALGRPSLLVPSPYVAQRHQDYNAQPFAREGAAVVAAEAELDGPALAARALTLLRDDGRLEAMAAAARRLARPEALDVLAAGVVDLARRRLPDKLKRT
ncbi:MAG: undecaprenyldiphospho-muramoylpentapeptide beta-N-acetylglucosaminyltransferase [Clostridia bacterium]|nr:undecaprenyldiphospho-muramoylpentapeptide beta-N-acetylglucosaminyltransferase [Clostridia bacterium]